MASGGGVRRSGQGGCGGRAMCARECPEVVAAGGALSGAAGTSDGGMWRGPGLVDPRPMSRPPADVASPGPCRVQAELRGALPRSRHRWPRNLHLPLAAPTRPRSDRDHYATAKRRIGPRSDRDHCATAKRRIGPRSDRDHYATAKRRIGPRSDRDHYATPNVGSVIRRQPPNPMIAVGPPMWLTQRSVIPRLAPLRRSAAAGDVPPIPGRVRERRVQGVVGDLRPPSRACSSCGPSNSLITVMRADS